MVSAVCKVEDGEHIGSLSRAGEHCRGSALKCGNLGRNIIIGGILESCIEISACFQIEELTHIFAGVIFKGSALNDGDHAGFAVLGGIARLDTFSFCFHAFPPVGAQNSFIF